MTAADALIQLLRSEVCGASPSDMGILREVKRDELYRLAKQQDLAHLAGAALEKLGLLGSDEISGQFQKQSVAAVYRHERMAREYRKLCAALSAAEIRHVPLKGSVLRQSYPEPWMRTSCDIDILVMEDTLDAAEAALTEGLGYVRKGSDDAHAISLYSPNGVHLELHHDLLEENWQGGSAEILRNVWQDVKPVDAQGFTLAMSDELFYFYHIAHMAKHFVLGGCGIRPFLDIWVLNHRVCHDREKRAALLCQGGLMEFAAAAEKLADVWFADGQTDETCRKMMNYLFRGGLYGGTENIVSLRHAKTGGKLGYVLSRIFLPMEELQMEYPILRRRKWLFPFCQAARWWKLLFGGKAGHWMHRLKNNAASDGGNTASNVRLLQDLGLWENA